MVREDDGLVLEPSGRAVLAREHVHLALVDAELAHVRLEVEDVGALHQRVQDLRGRERALLPPHDLAAPDAGEERALGFLPRRPRVGSASRPAPNAARHPQSAARTS